MLITGAWVWPIRLVLLENVLLVIAMGDALARYWSFLSATFAG
jgi:hypothetical protein